MKRQLMTCLLAIAIAVPLLAEARTLVRLEGWIVDSYCRSRNANDEATQDTLDCVKKGAKLLLITSDGTTYALENQERALEHLGKEVKVFGMVDSDRNLRIGNYIGSAPGPESGQDYNKVEPTPPPVKAPAPAKPTKKDD